MGLTFEFCSCGDRPSLAVDPTSTTAAVWRCILAVDHRDYHVDRLEYLFVFKSCFVMVSCVTCHV